MTRMARMKAAETKMSWLRAACAGVTLFMAVLANGAVWAADTSEWPQFLGPQRDGISREAVKLLDSWPDEGPKEVWRVSGGVGMAGLAVRRDQLCTLVQIEGQQWLIALDAKTGKQKWQTALAPEYKNTQGDGPRATPTIDGKGLFAFTGQGVLAEVNLDDGKIRWSHDVVRELGGKVADYGMASSPLLINDLVIVTVGAPQACVVAYRKGSGELAWKAGNDPPGYSSPALLKVGGRLQIVVFTGGSAIALVPETGEVLWRYPYETDYDCNIATPIAVEDKVFISSGENHGSALLELVPKGRKFEPRDVWTSVGPGSVLRCEWQTPVLLDGKLYGLDNAGSAGPLTNLTCVNALTGERIWQQPRFGKSNLIAADGKLLFSTMNGELVMVRATPKAFEELGRKQVLERTRQAPSLVGGLVYLRDDREIVCLDLRKP